MSWITTHILDIGTGLPAAGIPVSLERKTHSSGWQIVAQGMSNAEGRITDLLPLAHVFLTGHYRLNFDTGAYFALRSAEAFFPHITIGFVVKNAQQHYHVPLLLSPFGYTTYRGS
jgi:5-hydroxyisourate hydrolase